MGTDHAAAIPARQPPVDGEVSLTGHTRSVLPLPEVALTMTDQSGAQVARTYSGGDGQFRFRRLLPGTYVLIASKEGYRPHAETVALGLIQASPIKVSLDPTTRVYGVVHERRSGQPIPAASVSAIGPGGEVVAGTMSDPDGSYHITGIAAKTVTLVVAAERADPEATVVRLDTDDGTTDHAVDLAMDTYSTLSGTVTADGRALAQLPLTLYDHDGQTIATTVTDDNGAYRFDRINAGNYTVRSTARAPQATPILPEVTQVDVPLSPAP